jgi:hypothetical protein
VLILDDFVVVAVPPLDVLGCSGAVTELVMVTVSAVVGLLCDVMPLATSVVYGLRYGRLSIMPDDR